MGYGWRFLIFNFQFSIFNFPGGGFYFSIFNCVWFQGDLDGECFWGFGDEYVAVEEESVAVAEVGKADAGGGVVVGFWLAVVGDGDGVGLSGGGGCVCGDGDGEWVA